MRLFINERIQPGGHHVLDAFGNFCEPLGLRQERVEWNLPVPQAARDWAARAIARRPARRC